MADGRIAGAQHDAVPVGRAGVRRSVLRSPVGATCPHGHVEGDRVAANVTDRAIALPRLAEEDRRRGGSQAMPVSVAEDVADVGAAAGQRSARRSRAVGRNGGTARAGDVDDLHAGAGARAGRTGAVARHDGQPGEVLVSLVAEVPGAAHLDRWPAFRGALTTLHGVGGAGQDHGRRPGDRPRRGRLRQKVATLHRRSEGLLDDVR